MTHRELDTTTPARHDAVEGPATIALWSHAGVGAVSKYIVGALGAGLAIVITTFRTPILPSNIAQCVILGLGAIALYFGKASPDDIPDGAARWFQSAKVWITSIAALLTVVAPPIVGVLDTGEWRNLTGAQWLVVVVAVLTAFSSWATPKKEVTVIDAATGQDVSPTLKALAPIAAKWNEDRSAATVTTVPASGDAWDVVHDDGDDIPGTPIPDDFDPHA